jgi:alpha-D-ribose 1-methylphosphonate 5-triphosphate synthase subunit PhnH
LPAASITLLSPWAALVGVPALAALVGLILGMRRAAGVRRALGLAPPAPRRARVRLAAVAGVIAALTLAAAQPALTHDARLRIRQDVQALFVVDISRSMAASSRPGSPSRLDRATAAAVGLREAIPNVAAGVATLTDRVLPNLLPVPDPVGFEQVMARGVAIESPPPQNSAVRATSFDALGSIPGGGYFAPGISSRLVVVLTDGESSPVQTNELASAFEAAPGFHVVFIRFWRQNESIFDAGGERETAYRPDPAGGPIVDGVAAALRGNAYSEDALTAATRRLRELAGNGPTQTVAGTVSTRDPLAPYLAAVALLLLVALTVGTPLENAGLRWPR